LMNIELVKETYDPSTAPVKAWAAGIELEAKRQRMIMGIRHKLKQGKVRARSVLYGYQKNKNDFAELNDDEWPWVNKIWKWYSEGMSVTEIRNRLIAGNAPQRNKVQIPWRKSYIYRLLNIDTYHTGIQIYEWGGEIFELPYPIIVNEETVKRVIKIRNRRKQHPIRNVKHNYLSMALIYCDHCGIKLKSRSIYNLTYYSCDYGLQGYSSEGCCKTVRSDKIDNLLWQKVLELLQKDTIENAIEEKIKTLKVQEFDAKKEITNIEDVLINLKEERKWIITRARKKIITEEDMIEQLSLIRSQEESLKKELYDAKLVLENNVDHLSELIDTFRKNVWKGIEKLKQEPETEEEKNKQFQVKRKIVETIVKRINVFKDKSIEVKFIIDVRDKSLSPRLNYLEFSIFSLPFS
jgi:predicted oxidoreductase